MSKERALRRAARDQARAEEQAARERGRDRAQRRAAVRDAVLTPVTSRRRLRWRRQQGLLARRRRAQNAVIIGLFVVSQMLIWLFTDDPWWRVGGALLGVLSVPVLVTLALDRRR